MDFSSAPWFRVTIKTSEKNFTIRLRGHTYSNTLLFLAFKSEWEFETCSFAGYGRFNVYAPPHAVLMFHLQAHEPVPNSFDLFFGDFLELHTGGLFSF